MQGGGDQARPAAGTRLRPRKVLGLAGLCLAAACTSAPPPTTEVVSASRTSEVGPLLNQARAERGLSRLAESPALAGAAVAQARYTAARGQLTHRSAGGATVKDRIEARGYDACLAAENLAAGQATAAEVTAGWLTSPGHRSNMLRPEATHYGAGRAVTAAGMPYWVVVLARGC